MILSDTKLQNLCAAAIEAAQKAGALISSYTDKNVVVNNKKAADSLASQVVTEVDIKAQETILDILAPTLSEYDLALLTEESVDDKSRFEKDYFWCIDPMDGTLAFTEKTPGYAVSIALVAKNGDAQLGVVFDPVTNTLYSAIKNKGAYKNGSVWSPLAQMKQANVFHLFIDRSYLEQNNCTEVINAIEKEANTMGIKEFKIEKLAGAVLNACQVMDKAPGCYFKVPKPESGGGSLWDFAATACIVSEVGGYCKSMDGSALDLNRSDSTFMNHKGALYASNSEIAERIKTILYAHHT